MNPSPAAISVIKAQVTDWSPTDVTIVTTLNAPSVNNPTPRGTVPRTMYESELAALLTDESNGSLVKLLNWVNFGLVKADIEANNLVGVQLWAGKLALLGIVTADESTAIVTYTQPVDDPNWPAQISWAQANLGRAVDTEDIAIARVS